MVKDLIFVTLWFVFFMWALVFIQVGHSSFKNGKNVIDKFLPSIFLLFVGAIMVVLLTSLYSAVG